MLTLRPLRLLKQLVEIPFYSLFTISIQKVALYLYFTTVHLRFPKMKIELLENYFNKRLHSPKIIHLMMIVMMMMMIMTMIIIMIAIISNKEKAAIL